MCSSKADVLYIGRSCSENPMYIDNNSFMKNTCMWPTNTFAAMLVMPACMTNRQLDMSSLHRSSCVDQLSRKM